MMNVLAMCLVLSSLVTAGFWSPTPENNHHQHDEAVLKERHRVLVVEYEKERNNNNDGKSVHREVEVSNTPSHQELPEKSYLSEVQEKLSSGAEDVKERAREAASVLPNLGLGLSGEEEPHKGPRDLICDAYGKCKHKIASALGKTKDTLSQTTEHVSDKAHEMKEGAKDTVRGASDKAKEAVGGVYDKAEQIKEVGKDKVSQASEGAKEAVSDAAAKVKETATDTFNEAGKKTDTIGQDLKKNVSMTAHAAPAEGILNSAAEKAGEVAKSVKGEGEKELKEILRRGREVARDMLDYAVPVETVGKAVDGAMGVVQLLGLSTAYGMCVWVTFMASYVLAEALPKQQFAVVQSKMYPVYFKAMATSIAVALLGHVLTQRSRLFTDKGAMFQGANLLVPLFMVLFNSMYLEPRATKVMFERMKMEKEEGRGRESSVVEPSRVADTLFTPNAGEAEDVIRLGGRTEHDAAKQRIITHSNTLKKLNKFSSLLNVLTLMSLTSHLVTLGRSIDLHC